jgi:hypothetical protein
MSMLEFLGLQALIFLVAEGWGRALLGLDRERFYSIRPLAGLGIALATLPLIHLVVPMRSIALLLVAIPAVIGWVVRAPRTREGWKWLGLGGGAFLMLGVIVVWPLAMGLLTWYDAGLYYQQVQKWAVACPVVPGIGNLHSRLAFPGASLLGAALLDFVAGPAWGARLLGGAFAGLGLLHWSWVGWEGWKHRDPIDIGFGSIGLWGFGGIMSAQWVPAAAPDVLIALLVLAFAHLVVDSLIGKCRYEPVIALLGASLPLLKLSSIVWVPMALGLVAWKFRWRPGKFRLALVLLMGCGWILHNWIQSGWPVYPSGMQIGWADWSMEPGRVRATAEAILGWARAPGAGYRDAVEGWAWLPSWLAQFSMDPYFRICTLLALVSLVIRYLPRCERKEMDGFLPLVGSLLLAHLGWFLLAPDSRFVFGLTWALSAVFLARILSAIPVIVQRVAILVPILVVVGPLLLRVSAMPIQPAHPAVDYTRHVLPSGLAIWVPAAGDQGWSAPLPSSPEIANIEGRGPDLCDGFRSATLTESSKHPAVSH